MNARQAAIAIFMPSFRGGGAERSMLNLAAGLAAGAESVALLVAQNEGALRGEVPATVRVVDLRAARVAAALPALARFLRRERPRALLSALPHANVVAVWARFLAGTATRLVLSEHTTASVSAAHAHQRRARILPFFMRRAYPHADAVVAVSDAAADDLARLIGLDRARITRIYNPVVTPALFDAASRPPDDPWFAPDGPPIVMGAGRLTPAKDFGTLVRAFAELRRGRDARLVILGEGDERAQLSALVRELGLEGAVQLPGFVANPWQYMARAAVFALSSRWEGFGNVLVEAMACGVPVVATDCPGGPREILEGGRHGLLVPVGDPAALARALRQQLDEPMRGNAEARAAEFSAAAAVDAYRRVLRA